MKPLALALLLALPAHAQDAGQVFTGDAGVVTLLPDGSVCLDAAARKANVNAQLSCEAGYADLKASVKAAPSPVPVVIVAVAGVVLAAVVGGVGFHLGKEAPR